MKSAFTQIIQKLQDLDYISSGVRRTKASNGDTVDYEHFVHLVYPNKMLLVQHQFRGNRSIATYVFKEVEASIKTDATIAAIENYTALQTT